MTAFLFRIHLLYECFAASFYHLVPPAKKKSDYNIGWREAGKGDRETNNTWSFLFHLLFTRGQQQLLIINIMVDLKKRRRRRKDHLYLGEETVHDSN